MQGRAEAGSDGETACGGVWCYGIAVDGAGNVLVTGPFTSTIDFGDGPLTSAGDYDLFLAKLAP